jgi:hypothetical protein
MLIEAYKCSIECETRVLIHGPSFVILPTDPIITHHSPVFSAFTGKSSNHRHRIFPIKPLVDSVTEMIW